MRRIAILTLAILFLTLSQVPWEKILYKGHRPSPLGQTALGIHARHLLLMKALAAACANSTFSNTSITCVQVNSQDCTSVLTCTLAIGANTAIGDALFEECEGYQYTTVGNANLATLAASDSQGNVYTNPLTATTWTSPSGNKDAKDAGFFSHATGATNATFTCTTASGGTPAVMFQVFMQLHSPNGSISVDSTVALVDGGGVGTTTCTPGSIVTVHNNALVLAYCDYGDGSVSAGSGFLVTDASPTLEGEGKATAGSLSLIWTASSVSHWVAAGIAFTDVAAGGGGAGIGGKAGFGGKSGVGD